MEGWSAYGGRFNLNGLREECVNDSILCQGFQAAGVAAGIKKKNVLDLGMIYCDVPSAAAGLFTRNRVKAAPVLLSSANLVGGAARAVIANAGNANCCNGETGMDHARTMAADTARRLGVQPADVIVASTGVIGAPLPIRTIQSALPDLVSALRPDGFNTFARAIMTTDTVPKLVSRRGHIDGRAYTIVAAAKGAGMIRPDMATMLCFVCSDVSIAPPDLQQALKRAVDRTLNCITIDGDTSTNDTITIMANGLSGAHAQSRAQLESFEGVLEELLAEVARMLVKDGEGVTKVVGIKVRGGLSDDEALAVADTVAHSPLVKTAFFGEDANWGRIMAAAGRAGVAIDPDAVDIFFDRVQMVRAGRGCGARAEADVTAVLKQPEFDVIIDLHQGNGTAAVLTSDFSVDYVKINADYRS
jgi:glutamate N-acetyltransferase / amino-acid N-acetyltransferase